MQDLGWVEGRNLMIQYRHAESIEQRPQIGAELLQSKLDVIVATPASAFVFAPSGDFPIRTVPIVFTAVSDPVGAGMVASLARPGGNMTGLSYQGVELNTKRLQLLREALPGITRVAVLAAPGHPLRDRMVREIQRAARELSVQLQIVDVASGDSLEAAFESIARGDAGAFIALQGAHFFRERKRIADLALKHRLPGIFELAEFARAGGLLAYAPNLTDLFRRAAGYVDRILKGARPADLPVEQPTKFELIINLKTAKALGLSLPSSLLLRADEVLQ